jgi:hypothetical protein
MTKSSDESQELRNTLARLNARAWGIAVGLLLGGGLFLATIFLVARGGINVGQHLILLRAYFPGYSVSIVGSFIGFVYGFVLGYAIGRIVGMVYNRLVSPPA